MLRCHIHKSMENAMPGMMLHTHARGDIGFQPPCIFSTPTKMTDEMAMRQNADTVGGISAIFTINAFVPMIEAPSNKGNRAERETSFSM